MRWYIDEMVHPSWVEGKKLEEQFLTLLGIRIT